MAGPGAKSSDKNSQKEGSSVEITINFGIFFDGTNNNKYQVMLGKRYHRIEVYKKYKYRLGELGINNENDIVTHPRSYWETGKGKGVFSKSEIDKLYFGYTDINDTNTTEKNYAIEERIISSISRRSDSPLMSNAAQDAFIKDEALKHIGKESKGHWFREWKAKGAPEQGATYSNVAILEACFNCNYEQHRIPIYVEGSGASTNVVPAMQIGNTIISKTQGLAAGLGQTGVQAKIYNAFKQIRYELNRIVDINKKNDNPYINIVFDVFGFSRGSTEARIFTHIISNYNTIIREGKGKMMALCGWTNPLPDFGMFNINNKEIRFLGIMDTVSSIGVNINGGFATKALGKILARRKLTSTDIIYHHDNVDDYGLHSTNEAKSVFHICAMDEFRENFALVDIESSVQNNGLELFLPGCHTDIGGAAGIGREEEKIVNKKIKGKEVFWPLNNMYSWESNTENDIIPSNYLPVSSENFTKIGWLYEGECISSFKTFTNRVIDIMLQNTQGSIATDNDKNIIMYRYVQPGYSNVSLHLMYQRAKDKGSVEGFTVDIPPAYSVPQELTNLYDIAKKKIKKNNGRYAISPDLSTYCWLRQNYLHFSSNDQIMDVSDNEMVNGASYFKDRYVSRIIYAGKEGKKNDEKNIYKPTYMCNNNNYKSVNPVTYKEKNVVEYNKKAKEERIVEITEELEKLQELADGYLIYTGPDVYRTTMSLINEMIQIKEEQLREMGVKLEMNGESI